MDRVGADEEPSSPVAGVFDLHPQVSGQEVVSLVPPWALSEVRLSPHEEGDSRFSFQGGPVHLLLAPRGIQEEVPWASSGLRAPSLGGPMGLCDVGGVEEH